MLHAVMWLPLPPWFSWPGRDDDSRDTRLVTMPALLVLWNAAAQTTQPLSSIVALTLRSGALLFPPLLLLLDKLERRV